MEQVGLIGQPNSGKSSLFNALTNQNSPVAPHPYTTTSSLKAAAEVPDTRLDALAEMSSSKKTVYTVVEIMDIAGLSAGANAGEGLGNKFLAQLREVDALGIVLRSFEDESIVGSSDVASQLAELEMELVLADLNTVENQIERRRKAAKNPAKNDLNSKLLLQGLEAVLPLLSDGIPVYKSNLDIETRANLKEAFLLTTKPVFVVVNISEDQIGSEAEFVDGIKDQLPFGVEPIAVCVQLEAEAAQLEAEEKTEMLEGLGLGDGVLSKVAKAAHEILNLNTFFTTGDKESRGWTFRVGSTAPVCAGVIHSDLQRGFIKAEVIDFQSLLDIGSWHKAKSEGKIRLEGKEYIVKDGDVMEIRFNV